MASGTIKFGVMEDSVVRELANIGLGHATTALASLTGKTFDMHVPKVESLQIERIPYEIGGVEEMTVGIFMQIESETGGHIGFLMPWSSAQKLWKMLVGDYPETPDDITELHASAMLETGNIIDSGFLNAIADMTGIPMCATPAQMSVDMCAAILQTMVSEASLGEYVALTIETAITNEEDGVEGFFVYIPTVGGLRTVFQKLGIPEAA